MSFTATTYPKDFSAAGHRSRDSPDRSGASVSREFVLRSREPRGRAVRAIMKMPFKR